MALLYDLWPSYGIYVIYGFIQIKALLLDEAKALENQSFQMVTWHGFQSHIFTIKLSTKHKIHRGLLQGRKHDAWRTLLCDSYDCRCDYRDYATDQG